MLRDYCLLESRLGEIEISGGFLIFEKLYRWRTRILHYLCFNYYFLLSSCKSRIGSG